MGTKEFSLTWKQGARVLRWPRLKDFCEERVVHITLGLKNRAQSDDPPGASLEGTLGGSSGSLNPLTRKRGGSSLHGREAKKSPKMADYSPRRGWDTSATENPGTTKGRAPLEALPKNAGRSRAPAIGGL